MKNHLTYKIISILLFSITTLKVGAQTDTIAGPKTKKFSFSYTLSYEQGSMISNGSEKGDQLAQSSYYNGVNLQLGFHKNNQVDIYNRIYHLPVYGIGWYASTFHQQAIGNPNAVYYFLKLPLWDNYGRKFSMSFLAAFGISYNFNHYDSITNPLNIYIGSDFNSYVNMSFMANYRFNHKWMADMSLGLKHFSNGSMKLPNFGINLVPVSISLTYKPSGFKPYTGDRNRLPFTRHNQYNIALIAAVKNYEPGGPTYMKTELSLNWLRMLNYKFRAGIGFDACYTAKSVSENNVEPELSEQMSYSIVGSAEWVLTKHFYIPIGLGFYLRQHEENDELKSYYERIGIRYRFNNKIFAGITIKAHKDVADIFEWTLGYTFLKDNNKY